MARSRKGSGMLRRRGDRWEIAVDVGRQPAQRCSACRRRVWVERSRTVATCARCGAPMREVLPERRLVYRSSATEADARDELAAILGSLRRGQIPADITFAGYVEAEWLPQAKARVRATTRVRYEGLLRDHVLPVVGDLRLDRLRPADVRKVVDGMAAQGLSSSSIRQARAVMNAVMRAALVDEVVTRNPVPAVLPPTLRRRDLIVPDAAAVGRMLSAAESSTYRVPLTLLVATGGRRSEVLGLAWSEIDLSRRTVRVVRNLQRVPRPDGSGRDLRIMPVKTPRARREVVLPAFAVEMLRQHRKDQSERQFALGSGWFRDDEVGQLVCDRGDGGPIDPDNLSAAFKRCAKAAGLDPRTRLHDVRHAVATKMMEDGVPLAVVSAMLGHSSASFTASTYQHALRASSEAAADALDAAFGRS